jgi:spermidine/putrescine transport system permease protein
MLTNLNQIPVLNAEIITALSLTILFAQLFKVNFGFATLLIGHGVLTVPFVVLSVMPKLMQMDPNSYEAALDLGATPNKALFSVILPEVLPGIFSGLMLSFTLSLDDYIITAFTRNDSFSTLSTYIYGVTAKGPLPAELRAFTTLFVLAVAIIIVGYNFVKGYKFNKKKGVGGR